MHQRRPSDDTAVDAAILAGGRATRMDGIDKSALHIGGLRIIERQLRALREITDSIVVVGGDPARFAELGVRAVPDVLPGCGALGGIYSALLASDRERTLVVACDMPFLSPALLRRLARPCSSEIDAVMPRSHEGLQPLCAVYAARSAATLRRRIERGMLKAASVGEDVRVEEIGPEELASYDADGLMFMNVNTPHDYERAKSLWDRAPGSGVARGNRITEASS
jgi:molybdopterin-guanine dinucleotide biosynthesis protein A